MDERTNRRVCNKTITITSTTTDDSYKNKKKNCDNNITSSSFNPNPSFTCIDGWTHHLIN